MAILNVTDKDIDQIESFLACLESDLSDHIIYMKENKLDLDRNYRLAVYQWRQIQKARQSLLNAAWALPVDFARMTVEDKMSADKSK